MKKKILAILLAAIMVAMLLPMAAFAEAGSITTWKALQDAITKVGTTETTIQLTCDITALETDSSLTIGEGQKITIDLNGFVLNRGMYDSDGNLIPYYLDHGDTYQIIVKGELTIKDSNPTKTHQFGVITEGDDKGVWYLNEASGTNKVAGGIFTGCFRGAVSVDGGKFTLESGNIIGNVTDEGSVDVDHGTFVMNGGMIMGNRSVSGDCVRIDNNSCFIMNNGEIRSNIAPEGSAVYIYRSSTFTMNNGKISDHKGYNAGGVSASTSSLFEMNGGEISGNLGYNGGIYLEYDTTFKMHGGKIFNNGSDESLIGGVHITNDASFIMDGGLISGNTGNYAGGVCSEESKFILGGKAQIKGNTVDDGSLSNVHILDLVDANIELGTGANGAVAPQDGFSVGVTTKKAPASGTPVVFSSNGSANDTKYFFSDSENYYVGFDTKLQLVKPEANQYLVIIPSSDNGVVYTDKWVAAKSEKVTLSYFADDGYAFKSWEAVSGIKADAIADNSFTMPADKVKVTAKFEKAAEKPEDKKSPQTGDTSNMALWVMLLALSSMGLCACLAYGNKRKNEQ